MLLCSKSYTKHPVPTWQLTLETYNGVWGWMHREMEWARWCGEGHREVKSYSSWKRFHWEDWVLREKQEFSQWRRFKKLILGLVCAEVQSTSAKWEIQECPEDCEKCYMSGRDTGVYDGDEYGVVGGAQMKHAKWNIRIQRSILSGKVEVTKDLMRKSATIRFAIQKYH